MATGVAVMSKSDAADRWSEFDAVITIEDTSEIQGVRVPDGAGVQQLVLRFDDVVADVGGRHRADRKQIVQALEWARVWRDSRLLIHCEMGVSRSAAIALGILAERLGAGSEHEAVSSLLSARPVAACNPYIVATVDEILGRGGMLVEALRVADEKRFSGRFFIP